MTVGDCIQPVEPGILVIRRMWYRLFRISIAVIILTLAYIAAPRVLASTEQASRDYIHHYDLYRQYDAEFKVAKNEYEKFKTLVSQTAALEAVKKMLTQRDEMYRTYLLLLSEKILETERLSDTERSLYQTLIQNELKFLNTHMSTVPSISSIQDANAISADLESHAVVLNKSIRQIILGISLGELRRLQDQYDTTKAKIQTLYFQNQSTIPTRKQVIIDRWMIQIDNKRTVSQEKFDTAYKKNEVFKAFNDAQIEKVYQEISSDLSGGKQYLIEGISFMKELMEALKYAD